VIGSIGVVGLGMVGGAVSRAFAGAGVGVCGYDRYLSLGAPERLAQCPVVFLCVPTPSFPNGGLNLGEVWSAVSEIEELLAPGSIVAVKSTVPPGTIDRLAADFPRIEFAALPEFLIASKPDETFTHPDRVIIGTRSPEVATLLAELVRKVAPEAPVLVVQPVEAELIKLCSNALLATKVAVANQLAEVCELYEVPWPSVKAVVALDRRIGPDHLSVTEERGFGGACLPKDLDGLIAAAESAGSPPSLLRAIAEFNRQIRAGTGREVPDAGAGGGNEQRRLHAVAPNASRSADRTGP
jgi:UDPglucose 6-dehydrogenase